MASSAVVRQRKAKRRADPKGRVTPNLTAVTTHERLHVGQPHPLTVSILPSKAAEEVEHLRDVVLSDSPAIVADMECRSCVILFRCNRNLTRSTGNQIVDCVAQQIAENLLERGAVGVALGRQAIVVSGEVSPRATAACKRLRTVLAPVSSNICTGSDIPFTGTEPRSSTRTKPSTSRSVAADNRMLPGVASCSIRAAKCVVGPTAE